MTKKILLRVITISIAVLSSPIQAWFSRDPKAQLYSVKHLIVTVIILLIVFACAAALETPRALAWNWPWHRFWFFRDLVGREEGHRRQILLGLNSKDMIALTEVSEHGKRRNLLELLLEKIRSLNPVPKILISGEGGSGKTTTLEQLRLSLARDGARRWGVGRPMPVLLRMGSVSSGQLLDNVRKSWKEIRVVQRS